MNNKGIIALASLFALGAAFAVASKASNLTTKFKATLGTPEKLAVKGTSISLNLPVKINNQSAVNVTVKNMYVTVQNQDSSGNWEDLFTQPQAIKEVAFAAYKTSSLPVIPLQLSSPLTLGKILAGKLPQKLKCIIRFDVLKFEIPPIEFEMDASSYLAPIKNFIKKNPLLSKLGLGDIGNQSESFHYRVIKSGNEYDKYFAKPNGKEVTIRAGAEPLRTIHEMQKIVYETLHQTAAIAKVLKGVTIEQSVKNVWQFLYNNIQYKKDEKDREQLREPIVAWADRATGIDCDCFSILASSILLNMGIDNAIKMCSTSLDKAFGHVYVVVPKNSIITNRNSYWVVDACLHRFDDEAKNITNEYYKNMRTTRLSGLDCPSNSQHVVDGLGNVFKKVIKKVATAPKAVAQKIAPKPIAKIVAKPAAPVAVKPAAPIAAKPATPVVAKPAAPVVAKPTIAPKGIFSKIAAKANVAAKTVQPNAAAVIKPVGPVTPIVVTPGGAAVTQPVEVKSTAPIAVIPAPAGTTVVAPGTIPLVQIVPTPTPVAIKPAAPIVVAPSVMPKTNTAPIADFFSNNRSKKRSQTLFFNDNSGGATTASTPVTVKHGNGSVTFAGFAQ